MRRLIAELRIAAGAEPARDCSAELHFVRRNRAGERLHIGVDRDRDRPCSMPSSTMRSSAFEPAPPTPTTLIGMFLLFAFGQTVIVAELNHVCSKSVSLCMSPHSAEEACPKNSAETRAAARSACTACAYLIRPIAVENCGFSKAEVRPDIVCACATCAGISKISSAR